jgi:hypothetical protein
MNVFGIAVDTLFADPNLRDVAVYLPAHGVSKNVYVISHKPDAFVQVGESFVATPTLVIDVRVADCPSVSPGDRFLIANRMYTVQGEPKLENDNLVYRIDLTK